MIRYRDDVIMDRQPNGVYNEKCTSINFFSIYSMNDWHDTACAYDKIRNYMCEIVISNTKGVYSLTNLTLKPQLALCRSTLFCKSIQIRQLPFFFYIYKNQHHSLYFFKKYSVDILNNLNNVFFCKRKKSIK